MSPTDPAAADLTRTLDVCSLCVTEVEHDAAGPCCEGARIVAVEVWRPLVALGVQYAPALGTAEDIKRLREELAAAEVRS